MPLSRREFMKTGAAAGALLMARPMGALARNLGPTAEFSTSRQSRLFPGTRLVHADLHNHTLYSDGDGDPENAFASMRAAGLDVAALTDHATVSYGMPMGTICPDGCGAGGLAGINEKTWAESKALADGANDDGNFTAIRGFEWSSPTLGHINVWFSENWTDPLHTAGATSGEGVAQFAHDNMGTPAPVSLALDTAVRALPTTGVTMVPFYDWFNAEPSRPVLGGGLDGIAGFNHPGRETGRFGYFRFEPTARDRLVSCEVFNRNEDYLFEGTSSGYGSPINECLNAGWKVGLLGVTDEHGTDWGYPDGKGRTGLWVNSLDRGSVREAMVARRFFSTRLRGLRVDASADGRRMGDTLQHSSGPIAFALDIDRGEEWWGHVLNVQILQSGTFMPTIVDSFEVTISTPEEPVITFNRDIDRENGDWVVLRITDPAEPADSRATGDWAPLGNAIAYTSPFFLG